MLFPPPAPRTSSAPVITPARSVAAALLCCTAGIAQRIDVSIAATRDVTLYEDATGQTTNDFGANLFVGDSVAGLARRALLAFDVVNNVPANSRIVFVQLQLTVAQAPPGATPLPVTIHRVQVAWPEGTTAASGIGDNGTQANAGDTTWLHRVFATTQWQAPGGDFEPVPSGSFTMPTLGVFALGSNDALVADVQAWLDGAPNHGWLLKTDELGVQTARRIHSRQTTLVGVSPQLQIGYVPPGNSWSRGPGCHGSNGLALHQIISGAPVRGGTTSVVVQNGITGNWTAVLLAPALAQTAVDIVPGCPYELRELWFDNLGPVMFDAQGTATYTFQVPNAASLLGFYLAMQSGSLDQAAPFSLSFSNGTLVVIG